MEDKPQSPLTVIVLVIVFALTIAVFGGVAFVCKRLLAQYVKQEDLRTVVSLLIAAAVTLGVLYALRAINRRTTKDT